MRAALTSIMVLASSLVFGQLSTQYKTNSGRDTVLIRYHRDLCKEIGLEPLYNSDYESHFRIWMGRRIVELWKSDDRVLGQVVYWAEEIVPVDEPPTDRYYSAKEELSEESVKKLYGFIDSFNIKLMPDEDEIDGWQQGIDGITYMVETLEENAFRFKTYWTPTIQDKTVKEAIVFANFIDAVEQMEQVKALWLRLEKTVPFECYGGGVLRSTCKGLTKRERRKMKKERNNYRQHLLSK